MEWLTEHFDVLLPIALVLFFVFQRMFVRDQSEEGPVGPESETESEARRIQEEIRRKIVARQQGRDPSEMADEQPPAYQETRQQPATFPRRQEQPPPLVVHRQQTIETRPKPRPVARRVEQVESASAGRDFQNELRQQRERLSVAREAKEAAMRRSQARGAPRERRAVENRPGTGDLRTQLLADLSTSDRMKRAFILKEVVDRPIGLRDRPDVFSNWS